MIHDDPARTHAGTAERFEAHGTVDQWITSKMIGRIAWKLENADLKTSTLRLYFLRQVLREDINFRIEPPEGFCDCCATDRMPATYGAVTINTYRHDHLTLARD